jgi:RNA polymerase sigma-B factor
VTPTDRHNLYLRVARDDDGLRVRVCGEVDRDTAGRLRRGLREAIAQCAVVRCGGNGLVVDLTGVPFVDAAGVAVLADAAESARTGGIRMGLTGVQPYVARTLSAAGLAPHLR